MDTIDCEGACIPSGVERFSADFDEVHPKKKTDARRRDNKKKFHRFIIVNLFEFDILVKKLAIPVLHFYGFVDQS